MRENLTREEVIEAGKEIVMGTSGLETFAFVFIAFGIIVLSDMINSFFKRNRSKRWFFGQGMLVSILILTPFWLLQGPTLEEKAAFKQQKEEWKQEYAAPYINDGLKKTIERNLTKLEYDKALGELGKKYYATMPGEGRVMPIKMTTQKGEEISMWVDTVIEENNQSPRLEYQVLDKMINAGVDEKGRYLAPEPQYGSNYPEGIYNGKLYVSQEDYDKLVEVPNKIIEEKLHKK